jgi:hypothetical protein
MQERQEKLQERVANQVAEQGQRQAEAIAAVFWNTLEGAPIGGLSSSAFAAIPAFLPALIPVLSVISAPLLAVGAFQLVNQIGQTLDRHAFATRDALLKEAHHQDAQFFENFDKQVMDFLYV